MSLRCWILAFWLLFGAVLSGCKWLPGANDRGIVDDDAVRASRGRKKELSPAPYFFDSQARQIEKNLGL